MMYYTVKLKSGTSYRVTEVLAEAMQKSIKDGEDKVVYHDKVNGAFQIKLSDIAEIR